MDAAGRSKTVYIDDGDFGSDLDSESDSESDGDEDFVMDDYDAGDGCVSFLDNRLSRIPAVRRLCRQRGQHTSEKLIDQDRRAAANMCYDFSILRDTTGCSGLLIGISTEVSELGLTSEMMLAWGLNRSMHIVLLIRMCGKYTSYDTLANDTALQAQVSFRIGRCVQSMPTVTEAAAAFGEYSTSSIFPSQFSNLLISKHAQKHMEAYFWQIAQLHEVCDGSWDEAYEHFIENNPIVKRKRRNTDDADHRSFPVVAMQFALDQLERYKTQCPVCYSPLAEGFVAVRPMAPAWNTI